VCALKRPVLAGLQRARSRCQRVLDIASNTPASRSSYRLTITWNSERVANTELFLRKADCLWISCLLQESQERSQCLAQTASHSPGATRSYTFGTWTEEDMGIRRVGGDATLLPNGDVMLTSGAQSGCMVRCCPS
jgi:hypothetical protein